MTTMITITANQTAERPTSVSLSSAPSASTRGAASRIPLFVPRDQIYYWMPAWQESERIALAEIAEGNVKRFVSGGDVAAWLLSDDE